MRIIVHLRCTVISAKEVFRSSFAFSVKIIVLTIFLPGSFVIYNRKCKYYRVWRRTGREVKRGCGFSFDS
ncbi:hypothetical protein BRYFOR_09018 [Marvinbryantia formatexigens DSM 14469]|uniref:Uncharacterized protein n=1 Tax=Marvinbryantia formatexigens DSM 14469 TaxID=478749 RepID=C6LK31_9FIRM|nr:hypothetical protein BRYFOR_09018 [Marvinbryantia formatexigens DSM 14469]